MFKKFFNVIAVSVFSATLAIPAMASEPDSFDLLKNMKAVSLEQDYITSNAKLDINVTLKGNQDSEAIEEETEGQMDSLSASINADINTAVSKKDNLKAKLDIDMDLHMLGATQDVPFSAYFEQEDDGVHIYMTSDEDQGWEKMLVSKDKIGGDVVFRLERYADPDYLSMLGDKYSVSDNGDSYKLYGHLDGSDMKDIVDKSIESRRIKLHKLTASAEEIKPYLDIFAADIEYIIDKDTYLPQSMSLDISVADEAKFKELISSQLGSELGGLSVDVNKISYKTVYDYAAIDPAVPEEIKSSASDAGIDPVEKLQNINF